MKILKDFDISLQQAKEIIKNFQLEMGRGLSEKSSSLKMIPTYVSRPSGKETGKFIALDLGGTHFRTLQLTLNGGGRIGTSNTMKFTLDRDHITGNADLFFGFIAECVKIFLKKYGLDSERELNLGFTFSFPVRQTAAARGSLICWTKDFDVTGVVGEDVVWLLKESLVKNGVVNVRISALVNDTVGTLVTRSYEDATCDVGVIIGTGTNACYPEAGRGGMIINIEWGNFDKLELTSIDKRLDEDSDNPGQQILEKAVSGMYLGRIASIAVKDILGLDAVIRTEDMSAIEDDHAAALVKTASVLKKAGIMNTTVEERRKVRKICEAVSRRGARISASCIAAVIKRMDPDLSRRHTVAIDGSLYEKHPTFARNMRSCLKEIFGSKSSFIKIALTKDGSGKGAAIVAAVVSSK